MLLAENVFSEFILSVPTLRLSTSTSQRSRNPADIYHTMAIRMQKLAMARAQELALASWAHKNEAWADDVDRNRYLASEVR